MADPTRAGGKDPFEYQKRGGEKGCDMLTDNAKCEHQWRFKLREETERFNPDFDQKDDKVVSFLVREDVFFCERCLESKRMPVEPREESKEYK